MAIKKIERLLIVPDTHAPYHDQRAWDTMILAARKFKPDTVVHMGDLCDFYAVSSHSKDPERALRLKEELASANLLLDDLDGLRPSRKVFLEGNHCDRMARYLRDKAPELRELVDVKSLLNLPRRGWEFVPYKHHIKIGAVYFTHDTGYGGKYATTRAAEAFQSSVVIGHHHSMSYLVHGDAKGSYAVAAQFGWLGDLNSIDYMKRIQVLTKWSLGFGVGYHDTETGVVFLVPCPMVDYRVCVEGKIYELDLEG